MGTRKLLTSVVFPLFEHVYGITDLSSPSPGSGILYASRANRPLCLRAMPGIQGEPRLPMVSLRSGAPRPVPARYCRM